MRHDFDELWRFWGNAVRAGYFWLICGQVRGAENMLNGGFADKATTNPHA
ncbi:hypothetical protein Z950_625 [Sulfitobacter mediterraneus KCTC 32188]|jgi:hypothetical protein|nr:hypothetical protein Z950_625 [Sulfitobacter mediterraneus KCTC 32188]